MLAGVGRSCRIWVLPHLGNQLTEAIKEDALAEYVQWRVSHAPRCSSVPGLMNGGPLQFVVRHCHHVAFDLQLNVMT